MLRLPKLASLACRGYPTMMYNIPMSNSIIVEYLEAANHEAYNPGDHISIHYEGPSLGFKGLLPYELGVVISSILPISSIVV